MIVISGFLRCLIRGCKGKPGLSTGAEGCLGSRHGISFFLTREIGPVTFGAFLCLLAYKQGSEWVSEWVAPSPCLAYTECSLNRAGTNAWLSVTNACPVEVEDCWASVSFGSLELVVKVGVLLFRHWNEQCTVRGSVTVLEENYGTKVVLTTQRTPCFLCLCQSLFHFPFCLLTWGAVLN